MEAMVDQLAMQWPALDLEGHDLPAPLTYERGVWGKVHGAPSDFHWIAATPGLTAPDKRLERELALGPEDAPCAATLWRTLGDTCYAIGLLPSLASDAAGRSGFLEKQVVEWRRPPEVPAALGALVLLTLAGRLETTRWDAPRSDVRWSQDDSLDVLETPPLPVTASAIEAAIDAGRRALRDAVPEYALTAFYAALLAGNRAVCLRGLTAPLPPAAVAALLLPLPRAIADALSIAGWLPSTRLTASDVEDVRRCWELVLGGTTAPPEGEAVPATGDQLQQAREMAGRLLDEIPLPATSASAAPAATTVKPIEIALWGPSAAGKTALLAKLFLEAGDDETWDVFPTEQSLGFIRTMRERMRTENLFPKATAVTRAEEIRYIFTHRKSGVRSFLQLEDRAGAESEDVANETISGKESLRARLAAANGLVLLFDPLSDEGLLEARVADTLELLNVFSDHSGRKEERPIAVCVSKADVLIDTAKDLQRAIDAPHDFVRERLALALVRPLDRYCTNYRLFPVSAAGTRLRRGLIEPTVFLDEGFVSRICPGSRPFNLMAPFSWILSQVSGAS
jgi:hypothetical protein